MEYWAESQGQPPLYAKFGTVPGRNYTHAYQRQAAGFQSYLGQWQDGSREPSFWTTPGSRTGGVLQDYTNWTDPEQPPSASHFPFTLDSQPRQRQGVREYQVPERREREWVPGEAHSRAPREREGWQSRRASCSPVHYRREAAKRSLSDSSYRELEAWAARYSHSLPRRRRMEAEMWGAAQGAPESERGPDRGNIGATEPRASTLHLSGSSAKTRELGQWERTDRRRFSQPLVAETTHMSDAKENETSFHSRVLSDPPGYVPPPAYNTPHSVSPAMQDSDRYREAMAFASPSWETGAPGPSPPAPRRLDSVDLQRGEQVEELMKERWSAPGRLGHQGQTAADERQGSPAQNTSIQPDPSLSSWQQPQQQSLKTNLSEGTSSGATEGRKLSVKKRRSGGETIFCLVSRMEGIEGLSTAPGEPLKPVSLPLYSPPSPHINLPNTELGEGSRGHREFSDRSESQKLADEVDYGVSSPQLESGVPAQPLSPKRDGNLKAKLGGPDWMKSEQISAHREELMRVVQSRTKSHGDEREQQSSSSQTSRDVPVPEDTDTSTSASPVSGKTGVQSLAPPASAKYPLWREPSYVGKFKGDSSSACCLKSSWEGGETGRDLSNDRTQSSPDVGGHPIDIEVTRLEIKKDPDSENSSGILVIDATCVIVRVEFIFPPMKEHVQYLCSPPHSDPLTGSNSLLPSETSQQDSSLPSETSQTDSLLPSETSQTDSLLPSEINQPDSLLPSETSQPDSLLPSETSQPDSLLPSETSQPDSLLPSETSQPDSLLPSETSQTDSLLPSETSQPDSLLPSETSQPDSSLHSETSQPDSLLPSETSQPDSLLPSENSQPDSLLPSETSQTDSLLPSETSQPDALLPSETSQPDSSLHSETSQPDSSLPSETSQPDSLLPSETSQPDSLLPSETSPPDSLLPSETSQPDSLLPSETSQPDSLLPSETSQPDSLLPSETSQPDSLLPSETSQPDSLLPSETSQPDSLLPSETSQPDSLLPSETSQTDSLLPSETSQPDSLLPSETSQTDSLLPSETSQPDSLLPSETSQTDSLLPSETSQPDSLLPSETSQTDSLLPSETDQPDEHNHQDETSEPSTDVLCESTESDVLCESTESDVLSELYGSESTESERQEHVNEGQHSLLNTVVTETEAPRETEEAGQPYDPVSSSVLSPDRETLNFPQQDSLQDDQNQDVEFCPQDQTNEGELPNNDSSNCESNDALEFLSEAIVEERESQAASVESDRAEDDFCITEGDVTQDDQLSTVNGQDNMEQRNQTCGMAKENDTESKPEIQVATYITTESSLEPSPQPSNEVESQLDCDIFVPPSTQCHNSCPNPPDPRPHSPEVSQRQRWPSSPAASLSTSLSHSPQFEAKPLSFPDQLSFSPSGLRANSNPLTAEVIDTSPLMQLPSPPRTPSVQISPPSPTPPLQLPPTPPGPETLSPSAPCREEPQYPRSLWDAVNRIRKHTAPDSENEEEEAAELWDPEGMGEDYVWEAGVDLSEEKLVFPAGLKELRVFSSVNEGTVTPEEAGGDGEEELDDMLIGVQRGKRYEDSCAPTEDDTLSCSSVDSHGSGDTIVMGEEEEEAEANSSDTETERETEHDADIDQEEDDTSQGLSLTVAEGRSTQGCQQATP